MKPSKSLRAAEFSEQQANALATALSEQAQNTLATKADLLQLEMKLGEKIAEIRAELMAEIADLRAEMADLRAEMIAEFAKIRTEMSLLRTDTSRWIVTALAFNFVATAGLVVTFFKLFAK